MFSFPFCRIYLWFFSSAKEVNWVPEFVSFRCCLVWRVLSLLKIYPQNVKVIFINSRKQQWIMKTSVLNISWVFLVQWIKHFQNGESYHLRLITWWSWFSKMSLDKSWTVVTLSCAASSGQTGGLLRSLDFIDIHYTKDVVDFIQRVIQLTVLSFCYGFPNWANSSNLDTLYFLSF